MKESNRLRYQKYLQFGKLAGITASAQFLVQAISITSGILIIRQVPTHEYAYYTLVNTALGAMAILSDGGIASGVMSQGGSVWNDPKSFGTVLVTGLALRRKFALYPSHSLTTTDLFIVFKRGVNPNNRFANHLPHSCILFYSFRQPFGDPLKLNKKVTLLQKNQVQVNVFRLVMLMSIFVFPWAFIAILCAGIPRIWGNFKLKNLSFQFANRAQPRSVTVQKELYAISKRVIPGAIYYCLSGRSPSGFYPSLEIQMI